LHTLGESLSPAAQVEVEFKVLSCEKLRRSPVNMFYYDLAVGHRRIAGERDPLAGCSHLRDAAGIPLHEATRLMMNRCSGLLFARERLERADFGKTESDFVGRNLAKAELAFGDAVLAAHGQYHWSCQERHQRLLSLSTDAPEIDEIRCLHAHGVEFKLHPVQNIQSREELREQHVRLVELGRRLWLWLESRRLGRPFASAENYVTRGGNKCPETSTLKNRLLHLRAFGLGAALGKGGGCYPRQHLFHALAILLWIPDALESADWRKHLARELHADTTDLRGWAAAYERLWHRFN
jgi:hypothetical protein